MVHAILDGRETQTRRIVNPQPVYETTSQDVQWFRWRHQGLTANGIQTHLPMASPYGQSGDRLWVRETHGIFGVDGRTVSVGYAERLPAGKTLADTDGGLDLITLDDDKSLAWAKARVDYERWRPSIFMPRWASRITLEVTGVRVERLQDISEADAIAEGIERPNNPVWYAVDEYQHLWDQINAKRAPWASNPWVWVIEFKRVAP